MIFRPPSAFGNAAETLFQGAAENFILQEESDF
jgi:hypothetical protein